MRVSIQEFKEGQKVQTSLLITQMTKGITTSGSPYASFVLQDQSGSIEAKLWDAKDEAITGIVAGKVAMISGEVLKYRNALQLRLYAIELMDEALINPSDYVATSNYSPEELKASIVNSLNSIQDPIYHALVKAVLQEFDDRLYHYPAAAKNHHDFAGGLATHVVSMIALADAIANLYPSLSRDLLISGVICHDIGKTVELSGPVLTEYTLEGKLIGHISIMETKIAEIAKRMGYQDHEQALLLRHLILSHHGEYEFGSPVLPLVMEAEILNYIDNIDARMNMFEKALANTQAGEWTQRIFPLENRAFYRPKKTSDQ